MTSQEYTKAKLAQGDGWCGLGNLPQENLPAHAAGCKERVVSIETDRCDRLGVVLGSEIIMQYV
jgi:hypothetical protein